MTMLARQGNSHREVSCDENGNLIVTQPASDNTITSINQISVAIGNISQTILPANQSRRYLLLTNDSDTVIYLSFGSPAELNKGIRLNPFGGSLELSAGSRNIFTGSIQAIHSGSTSKNILILEAY